MKQLKFVEDYISLMGSYSLIWPPNSPIVNLARYDKPIIESMTEQINSQTGLTDRQANLAYKLMVKYKRQLNSKGYTLGDLENQPQYKFPIRYIDRSRKIDIVDNEIVIQFPYEQETITAIRTSVNTVAGRIVFDRERRAWVAGITEPRIIWLREFGLQKNFEFGDTFNSYLNSILSIDDYAIKLIREQDQLRIINAESSLLDYVNEHVDTNNVLDMVDYSSLLGYEVDSSIIADVEKQLGSDCVQYLLNKESYVSYNSECPLDLESVVVYAETTKRWPIVVYESASTVIRSQMEKLLPLESIADIKNGNIQNSDIKCLFFSHWKQAPNKMKLLLSTHTLMIGHRRQQLVQNAEKIIYITPTGTDDNSQTDNT